MRIEFFEPKKFDTELKGIVLKRMNNAADILVNQAKTNGFCPVGTITRPMYKKGKYAGQKWTSRDAGRLRKSIRKVLPRNISKSFGTPTNIRVYAGHYMAWYAAIVEFESHFLRRAKNRARPKMKVALGVK